MRFSEFAAAALVAPLVAAHGGHVPGAPSVFGLPKELRARGPFAARAASHVAQPKQGPQLFARQGGANGRCGPSFNGASCAAGYCCSGSGYCGNTKDHCMAPDCLIDYGPGCDANKTPAGASTRNDARPNLGNVAYGGEGIYSCVTAGHVAITYDDGPYIYTDQVLDQFKARGAKATFFITGNNIGKGPIDESWSTVIKRMISEGHQVASHTWSHQDLSVITQQQRYDQMVKNEMAFRNILGKYPTYMRPPYSSCNAACQGVMSELGYVISYFDLDTDDYNQLTKEKIQTAKDNFKRILDSGKPAQNSKLAIGHDIHELTALNLTSYMLDYLYTQGYTAVTMGECMGDPESAWYRTSNGGSTPSPTTSSTAPSSTATGVTSKDGTCGGTNGYVCNGFITPEGTLGECCSQWGWCGNSIDHCGAADCNPLFGKCNTTPTGTATAPTTTPTSAGQVSKDATCGGSKGYTCKGFVQDGVKNECCSQYGWCGASADHCGTGCNPAFGICSSNVSSNASVSPSASSTSSERQVSTSVSSGSSALSTISAPSTISTVSTISALSSTATATSYTSTSRPPVSSSVPSSTIATSVRPSSAVSSSTIATSVRPSSVKPSASTPTPTSPAVSTDGNCGPRNGNKTCIGYKNFFGMKAECCNKTLGKCGNDAFSCGLDCVKGSGNCWF